MKAKRHIALFNSLPKDLHPPVGREARNLTRRNAV